MYYMEKKKKEIRDELSLKAVIFDDFIQVCPYAFDELRGQTRLRNLTDWRHVGLVIAFIDVSKPIKWGWSQSGRLFNRDHATAMYAAKKVTEAAYYMYVVDMVRDQRDKRLVDESLGKHDKKEINHTAEAINMLNRINTTGKKDEIVKGVINLRSYVNENINPNKL